MLLLLLLKIKQMNSTTLNQILVYNRYDLTYNSILILRGVQNEAFLLLTERIHLNADDCMSNADYAGNAFKV